MAKLFASTAGCDCDCSPGFGSSTTVEMLLMPLSRAHDVVNIADVEKAASAGVSHGATGAKDTGL